MRYHDFHLAGYTVSDFGGTVTLHLIYDYPGQAREESDLHSNRRHRFASGRAGSSDAGFAVSTRFRRRWVSGIERKSPVQTMKPRNLFGVVIRCIGLLMLIGSLLYLYVCRVGCA